MTIATFHRGSLPLATMDVLKERSLPAKISSFFFGVLRQLAHELASIRYVVQLRKSSCIICRHFHMFEWWSWSRPFRYVAKMTTVEGEKCPAFHTQRFDRFEYNIRVLTVHCILPYFTVWTHLCTQNSKCKYRSTWIGTHCQYSNIPSCKIIPYLWHILVILYFQCLLGSSSSSGCWIIYCRPCWHTVSPLRLSLYPFVSSSHTQPHLHSCFLSYNVFLSQRSQTLTTKWLRASDYAQITT